MSKHQRTRIYWREQGRAARAYADFRAYADVGGKREPLIPAGEKQATTDPVVAEYLVGQRLAALEAARRGRTFGGTARAVGLETFAAEHLLAKAKAEKVTDGWLEASELHLRRAVGHLGAARDLRSIGVRDVRGWIEALRVYGLSGGTIHHHLASLSNLYRRAQAEEYVPPGYNPVAAMMDKPRATRHEAEFLEVHEAALLLESARTFRPPTQPHLSYPHLYPLIATMLLTGGRRAEVLGLHVDDVSFERCTVTFRPNAERMRLKSDTSWRVVPLFPQLEEILRGYLFADGDAREGLLFPGRTRSGMLGDFRRVLDQLSARAGFLRPVSDPATGRQKRTPTKKLMWEGRRIHPHMLRHTWTAARLQCLDRGQPVSEYTVVKELGHGGPDLVRRIYGHLGQVRHRTEAVEYRVEQHTAILCQRRGGLSRTVREGRLLRG